MRGRAISALYGLGTRRPIFLPAAYLCSHTRFVIIGLNWSRREIPPEVPLDDTVTVGILCEIGGYESRSHRASHHPRVALFLI